MTQTCLTGFEIHLNISWIIGREQEETTELSSDRKICLEFNGKSLLVCRHSGWHALWNIPSQSSATICSLLLTRISFFCSYYHKTKYRSRLNIEADICVYFVLNSIKKQLGIQGSPSWLCFSEHRKARKCRTVLAWRNTRGTTRR